tara:strand:- start:933 stop:1394 length:462 start_codon:yes stop_codon:yes gene_type:complete
MTAQRLKNITGSCVFTLVGILLWIQTKDYSALGSVFPRTMAFFMVVTAVLLLVRSVMESPAPQAEATTDKAADILRGIALIAIMIAWLILIDPLGLLLASILAFACLVIVSERDNSSPVRMIFIMLCGVLMIWGFTLVMSEVMMIPIPRATLF